MKIAHKLIAGLIIIVTLFCVVSYISIGIHQRRLVSEIVVDSTRIAENILNDIDQVFRDRIEAMQVTAELLNLKEEAAASNLEFDRLADMHSFIDAAGRDWKEGKETPGTREIITGALSEKLKGFIGFLSREHGHAVFSEAYVTNKHGVIIGATGRAVDYMHAGKKWYPEAMKEEKFWVGDVRYNESSASFGCDIAVKLLDDNGAFAGFFKAVLALSEPVEHVREAVKSSKYKNLHLKLLTREGRLIYSTGGDYNIFDNFDRWPKIINMKGAGEVYAILGGGPVEGEEIITYFPSMGVEDYKGLGWVLVVEHELGELLAPATRLRNTLWVFVAIIALITLATGYLIAHSIAAPVRKLRDATAEIGKGRLDTRVDIKSRDEVGELARSFNRMTEELQEVTVSRDQLEKEIVERKRLEEELQRLATTDKLTGAYNRVKFEESIEIETERARRYGEQLSLIMLDIDYFKEFNDRHGHLAGDDILREMAHIINARKREPDLFFRWGGEEFILLAPETGLKDACKVAERMRELVEKHRFDNVGHVRISLGVTQFRKEDSIDDAIKRVDEALYRAKEGGRNQTQFTA